ncbi:hypothetical protein GCM10009801_81940 [Streptomyces albiaxialis]|uniref:Uncharacterized protein n=1 Tax=Streptomyces albiaxialis TaxID=329523 RepID=A0ABN2X6R3_9ACTN
MRTNRFRGVCAACSRTVEPEQGVITRPDGTTRVFCTPEEAAAHQPSAPAAADTDPYELSAAQVRITGTPAQCHAVWQALQLAPHLLTGQRSADRPRRDDDRVMLYGPVTIEARHLEAIERERQEAEQ